MCYWLEQAYQTRAGAGYHCSGLIFDAAEDAPARILRREDRE
jgi:hypothetical protein